MKKTPRRTIIAFTTALIAACLVHNLNAATLEISNAPLAVRYDDTTQTLIATERLTGKTFLTSGKLEGVPLNATLDGQKIIVMQSDGSTSLELRGDQPFVFVTKELRNSGAAVLDVPKIVPATFTVDLSEPASQLKTMGTGGLLAADKNPGSYFFLACADPATRRGVVAGWLTQDRGSGTVFSSIKDGNVEFKAQLEHGHLLIPPGETRVLDTLAIGCFPDARLGLEEFADAVKSHYNIKLHAPVATYCSWYAEGPEHGGAGNAKTTVELSKFVAKELKPFGLGVIQIDAYWETGPRIGGVGMGFEHVDPNGPYRDGIAPVAQALAQDGIALGLWWLPFGRHHMIDAYKNRLQWFVKRPDGTPLRQHSFGGTCLDCTHPEVQEHLKTLAKNMREWGVTYFKMDGLSCGAGVDHVYINDGYKQDQLSDCRPLHDPTKTNIEAMRLGLEIIRQGAGDDVFFSGCAATQNMRIYAGAIGLVDSMRVGPDFNHDGQGIRSGPLRGSRMYFMNGRIWWNDPDPCKVRTSNEGCVADPSINGSVSLNQARLTTSWVSLTGQFFLLSDWLPNLPQERLEVLRRTLMHHDATARPVDYFDNALANTWLVTDDKSSVRRNVIGVFNFYGDPLKVDYTCAKLGLDPAKTYHAFDFWANKPLPDFSGVFKLKVEPNSCRVIAVRAAVGHPVLLSTSRHVTQGIIDVTGERWSDNTLSGASKVIANDPYELRIRIPEGWKLEKADAQFVGTRTESVRLAVSSTESAGLARLTITCPASGPVNWNVSFTQTIRIVVGDAGDGNSADHADLGNLRLSAAVAKPACDQPKVPVIIGSESGPAQPLALWYRQPAKRWLEALPVGNGRLGAMVFGGVNNEKLALNESTLWSGAPSDTNVNPAGREHLAEIRRLLFDGKYGQARSLCGALLGRKNSYGTHLPLADLSLEFQGDFGTVTNYRRQLDLDEGIAKTEFTCDSARVTREVFASNPDNVLVLRLTAEKPGALNVRVKLANPYTPKSKTIADGDMIALLGHAWENQHSDGKSGVAFEGRVRVLAEKGEVEVAGDSVQITAADTATILVAVDTSFGGGDPATLCRQQIAEASAKSYVELRAAHVADYQRLFRRVALQLGGTVSDAASLPTDQRLAAFRKSGNDPQFAALFFQYGRYLMIAGSRENSPLPMNLQGLWNDNICCRMGWTCDYHLDINQQQNYWPAEVCNLGECHEPQFKLIEMLRQSGRRTAKELYGAHGWVAHVVTNAWGYTAPGWDLGWAFQPTGGIWMANDLWQHYQFTGDKSFLAERAYPTLKEAAEFFLDYMVEDPKTGFLCAGPACSPENSFIASGGPFAEDMGPVAGTVLVRELFNACMESSRILGIDADFRARLGKARDKLQPLAIGKHGQLREWRLDYDEAVPNHRHTSHLVAVYPCDQISLRRTPELAKAAAMTIQRRVTAPGFEDVEFTRGNFLTFYARLGDAEAAYKQLLGLLREDTYSTMLTYSRGGVAGAPCDIFIIDGNMSGAAGIAELLLQSNNGEIELLPALPKAWPSGKVVGLCARGGFMVDIEWENGKVKSYRIASANSRKVTIRISGETKIVKSESR